MKKEIEDEWRRVSERRASRIKDPKKAELYRERIERIITTINLKEPDRVPCILDCDMPGYWPAHVGITTEEFMFDFEKARYAVKKTLEDLQPDAHDILPIMAGPGTGQLLESLDISYGFMWGGLPGRKGVPSNYGMVLYATSTEWAKEDEYDRLLKDFYRYGFETLGPRLSGILRKKGPDLPATLIKLMGNGLSSVYNTFSLLREVDQIGIPAGVGTFASGPLEMINMLRGTKGFTRDMFRHPEELNKFQEILAPLMALLGVSLASLTRNPIALIPIHYTDSQMLSPKQESKFCWPYWKKTLSGLIGGNVIPMPVMELGEPEYLDHYRELPKGSCVLLMGREDFFKAEEMIGDHMCVAGGMTTDLLVYGTPQKVEERVKEVCERCMEGGGLIISAEDPISINAKPENMKAMVDATRKYGVYRR